MEYENIKIYVRYVPCFNSVSRENTVNIRKKKQKPNNNRNKTQDFSWNIQLNWKI